MDGRARLGGSVAVALLAAALLAWLLGGEEGRRGAGTPDETSEAEGDGALLASAPGLTGRRAGHGSAPCADADCPRCRPPLGAVESAWDAYPLHGVVLDEATGKPVPSAKVALRANLVPVGSDRPSSPFPQAADGEG
jgi:hypothetical protein